MTAWPPALSRRGVPRAGSTNRPRGRPAGAGSGPTCAGGAGGRTRPGGARTGARSGRSGRSPPGGWRPGPGRRGGPGRRWRRCRGCGRGARVRPRAARSDGLRVVGVAPEPLDEPLQGVPGQPDRAVGRAVPRSHRHPGPGSRVPDPVGCAPAAATRSLTRAGRPLGGPARVPPLTSRVRDLARSRPTRRRASSSPGSSGRPSPWCRGPGRCCRRAPCRTG